jgi:hypothetical protein
MTNKQPAKMARSYSQALGQIFYPSILEAGVADEAQSP